MRNEIQSFAVTIRVQLKLTQSKADCVLSDA